jgi:hypothetical protein
MSDKMKNRKFIAYFFFVGWDCISLGLHVCISEPNIEIHIPFGFIRIGWKKQISLEPKKILTIEGNNKKIQDKIFGWADD